MSAKAVLSACTLAAQANRNAHGSSLIGQFPMERMFNRLYRREAGIDNKSASAVEKGEMKALSGLYD
jgi:hypothetical protein